MYTQCLSGGQPNGKGVREKSNPYRTNQKYLYRGLQSHGWHSI